MVDNKLLKIILAPISLTYGLITAIRNLCYNHGIFKSTSFDFPVISVGNLTVGGTGKSPHIEHLIKTLSPYIKLGVLSRGYGRKTKGFVEVQPHYPADDTGDEPLQFKNKFPHTLVAVCENRLVGIPKIIGLDSEIKTILLDDAFQHRRVNPGLNILLTEYSNPYYQDYLVPSGRLREFRRGSKRADLVIVSKCPDSMSEDQKREILSNIDLPDGSVFFTKIKYGQPYNYFTAEPSSIAKHHDVLIVDGIAKPKYLIDYVNAKCNGLEVLSFGDHHDFDLTDMRNIKRQFNKSPSSNKIIVTTEKDAVRLRKFNQYILENKLPIFVLPIEIEFLFDEEEKYNVFIKDFLLNFTV